MHEYPKIQSIFKRDEKTKKFIYGAFTLCEFEYLQNNQWIWTEKIDGTNIRIMWEPQEKQSIKFGGKTNNAQISTNLYDKLSELFTFEKFEQFGTGLDNYLCLYGEGYGVKIQKGGGNYIQNGVDFILFDVKIGDWWLNRSDVEDIAVKLRINVVPIINTGTILEAIDFVKSGFNSTFGQFEAEGLVLHPTVELFARNKKRIITKIKHKDFI